ncbi:MAG: zinc ribbon domain-containing protein [Verrucomicrobiota bacterium]
MIKLICPECQHENEAERIYCHSCGARLDRSAISAKESPKENINDTRKRVRKMFDPTGLKFRATVRRVIKMLFVACALAALVQMILPPDVPAPADASLSSISQINFDLENAITRHTPPQLQYTEDQANDHLRYALKNKKAKLDKSVLLFEGGVVHFREGSCAITVERSIFGFSFFTGTSYAIRVGEAKPVVTNNGGSIGRLPVHPLIMGFGDIIFADVWSALDREYKLISKMGAIEFHDKLVVLTAPVAAQ